MRKLRVGAAVAAMGFAAMASADQLNISVLANGAATVTVGNSEAVTIVISGLVDADGAGGIATGSGLALFGTNIDADSSTLLGGATFDITDQAQFLVTAPAGMANFDRNLGLTNPPGPPSPVTGYSGTASGTVLLQIGGGQNTIGNVDPPAYPVGSVTTGVANNAATDLATGTLTTPAVGTGSIVLTLSACFANTLDSAVGPPFAVSSAQCNVVGGATINFGVQPCADADVNCDGIVSALDLAEIQAPLNWSLAPGAAANPRADVNGDNVISALDLADVQAPLNWASSTGPCSSPNCP